MGGGRAWKSPRLVAILKCQSGRLATEATMEPSATKRGSRGGKALVERRGRGSRFRRVVLMASHASRTRCSPLPTALGHFERGFDLDHRLAGDAGRYPSIKRKKTEKEDK